MTEYTRSCAAFVPAALKAAAVALCCSRYGADQAGTFDLIRVCAAGDSTQAVTHTGYHAAAVRPAEADWLLAAAADPAFAAGIVYVWDRGDLTGPPVLTHGPAGLVGTAATLDACLAADGLAHVAPPTLGGV